MPPLLPAMPKAHAAAEFKQRALQSQNPALLQEAFVHHLGLGDEAVCQDFLQRFETIVEKALGDCHNPEEKQQRIDYTGWLVSEMTEALETSDLGSATLRDLLEELARHYPRETEDHDLRL